MKASDWRGWPSAHPVRTLVLLYVLVRLAGLAVGMRFNADNLTSWMQIADLDLLRHHLWRTLWYLHSQPPLFNLMIGLSIRLGSDGFLWAMGLIFAVVTLGGILATYGLVSDLSRKPTLALVVAAWLCVSPAVLLFSQKLYYDGLVPWLAVMGLWGLHAGATRRSGWWMLSGFAMLAALVLLRSMIHPVVFVAVAVIYTACCAGQRWRVVAASAAPTIVVAAVVLKNVIVFGTMSLSSWPPLNFDAMMVDPLPQAQREAMVRRGDLSPYAVIPGFSPPSAYIALVPPSPPTGEPSLDNLRKSTGEDNWNHRLYLTIARPRMHDALVGLRTDPASYGRLLVRSVYHFHRPSSEFKGLEDNRARIADWERIGNAVVGLQPAAWFGPTDDHDRPQALGLQLSYTTILESAAFGGFLVLLGLHLLRRLGERRPLTPEDATLCCIAMIGVFVIVVSNACDTYENNRAHFDICTIMLVGALVFASRIADRFGMGRRRPAMTFLPA